MPYKLTVDLPNLADGGGLVIDGLGIFYAGDNDLTDDQVTQYENANVKLEPQFTTPEEGSGEEPEQVGVSRITVPITELLKDMLGVSVEYVGESDSAPVVEETKPEPVNLGMSDSGAAPELQLDLGGND